MIIETKRNFKKNPLGHSRRLEWSVWEDILFYISTAKDDNSFYFYLNVFRMGKRPFVILEIASLGWMISLFYGRE